MRRTNLILSNRASLSIAHHVKTHRTCQGGLRSLFRHFLERESDWNPCLFLFDLTWVLRGVCGKTGSRDPLKKAVIMVPIPTIAESSFCAIRQKIVPTATQTTSVVMRAQRNAMRFLIAFKRT